MNRTLAWVGLVVVLLGTVAMAGPIYGFTTMAADRGISVGMADDETAYVGFQSTGEDVESDSPATIAEIQNNLGSGIDPLEVSVRFDAESADRLTWNEGDYPTALGQGESTPIVVECAETDPQWEGTASIDVIVDNAEGDGITVADASVNVDVEYDCHPGGGGGPPGGQPGDGFQSVDASSVTAYSSDDDDQRQTITFQPEGDLRPNSVVSIDFADPQDGTLDYNQGFWDGDLEVERGDGDVNYNGGTTINYQVDPQDDDSEIELSIGSFQSNAPSGPYEITITREDEGETGTAEFVVEQGDEPLPEPFEEVSAENVGSNVDAIEDDEVQTFTFTEGIELEPGSQVRIDVSDAQGNGVDYTAGWWTDVSVQQGDGWGEYDENAQEIVYNVGWGEETGEQIVLTIANYGTDSEGGPYEVTFTRTDTGDEETTTFEIE